MSAIKEFVDELKRQRDLLEWADDRDSTAQSLLDRGIPATGTSRRIWTRQDKNRLGDERGQSPPSARMDTRLSRIRRKLPDIEPLKTAALREAEQRGIYGIVATMIIKASEAHRRFLHAIEIDDLSDEADKWDEIEYEHDESLRVLADHLPDNETPPDFVPNTLQRRILDALNGRAMKKQALADKVTAGEGSRLYRSKSKRSGDLNELLDLKLVENKRDLGYFRPDAPPKSHGD